MKNKKLLQKAGSWILSAALAVSCLSGIPAATANAADDLSDWKSEIYIDFGTGLNGTGSADTDLAENILLAQDMHYTCNGTLIAGYGTWLYDNTDVGTVHGGAATSQKIGFDRVLPAGVVTAGGPGKYFRDWVFSPDGKDYTFSVDLPVGQYYVYVYTGNKTGGYDNISKVAFSDNNYQVIYDQTSAGGGQYKTPGCVYVVNVDEKTAGCGYGTVSVKIFDDTIVTADDGGYDNKYNSTNTVFYNQDSNVTFTSNGTTIADGKIVTARLNGIEFLPVENATKAESVAATEESTDISIETEQTKTLVAAASPETATERIEYFSSDEEIVKVEPRTGEITGVAPGTATITATTPSLIGDTSKSVTYNVTVYEVTSLALDPASLSLELDPETGTAAGTITAKFDAKNLAEAQNALNKSVTSSIATVTFGDVTETEEPADGAKGKYSQPITITANAKGTETLTIARTTGREASLNLTVTKPVTSVAFYDADEAVTDKYSMVAGTTLNVKAKGLPEDASGTGVRYSFKETTDIATITTGGRITARKSGTAVIVAASTSKTDITAEATLTITPGFEISYTTTEITMTAGQTSKNEPTISYKDGVNQSQLNTKVTYSSDNEKVAKVDKDNGTVSALAVGTANITATAEDGGQHASYKVTVNAAAIPATGINIKNKNITLDLSVKSKKTANINASLVPDTSTDTLSYSVPKNCEAIKVDNNGLVTALKTGSATVTVKSSNNITTTVKVTVKASATKLKVSGKGLKKNKVTLKKGKTLALTAKVTPNNSTDKVKWSVDKKKVATVKKTKKGVTVTAKKKGKAKITAKAGKKSVTITVTVK